jgi:hypothetical protein
MMGDQPACQEQPGQANEGVKDQGERIDPGEGIDGIKIGYEDLHNRHHQDGG